MFYPITGIFPLPETFRSLSGFPGIFSSLFEFSRRPRPILKRQVLLDIARTISFDKPPRAITLLSEHLAVLSENELSRFFSRLMKRMYWWVNDVYVEETTHSLLYDMLWNLALNVFNIRQTFTNDYEEQFDSMEKILIKLFDNCEALTRLLPLMIAEMLSVVLKQRHLALCILKIRPLESGVPLYFPPEDVLVSEIMERCMNTVVAAIRAFPHTVNTDRFMKTVRITMATLTEQDQKVDDLKGEPFQMSSETNTQPPITRPTAVDATGAAAAATEEKAETENVETLRTLTWDLLPDLKTDFIPIKKEKTDRRKENGSNNVRQEKVHEEPKHEISPPREQPVEPEQPKYKAPPFRGEFKRQISKEKESREESETTREHPNSNNGQAGSGRVPKPDMRDTRGLPQFEPKPQTRTVWECIKPQIEQMGQTRQGKHQKQSKKQGNTKSRKSSPEETPKQKKRDNEKARDTNAPKQKMPAKPQTPPKRERGKQQTKADLEGPEEQKQSKTKTSNLSWRKLPNVNVAPKKQRKQQKSQNLPSPTPIVETPTEIPINLSGMLSTMRACIELAQMSTELSRISLEQLYGIDLSKELSWPLKSEEQPSEQSTSEEPTEEENNTLVNRLIIDRMDFAEEVLPVLVLSFLSYLIYYFLVNFVFN
jgi:hypothetical protein